MRRTVLVAAVMVLGITLLLWSGWHNLRERRLAMQRAQENRAALAPAKPGETAATEAGEPRLRGKAAPGFSLLTLDGRKVSLADYKGRPVLVNFWATWCAPCKLEMPWFQQFRTQYAAQGFEVLGITEDYASKDEIAKAVKKVGVNYPILLTDGKASTAYGGVDYLPMSFYVDRNGVVAVETAGLASKDEVEANIRKILGEAPAPAATQAAGQ